MVQRVDIIVSISMQCNLRCRYCDVLALLDDPTRMSLGAIERMFENVRAYYERLPEPTEINFQWYGGEPLLIPPAQYREIFHLQRRAFAGSALKPTNSIQSNFTVLDDERIALLKECFGAVGASIDLFSGLRVNKAGVDQEERARKNIARALDAGVQIGGVTVLSRPNLARIKDIYAFYRDRKISMRLLPLERGTYAPGQAFEVTPEETLRALCELADLRLADPHPAPVEPVDRYLGLVRHMLAHPDNRVNIYERKEWTSVLLVAVDGSVRGYGDRFASGFGNLFSTPLDAILAGAGFETAARIARERVEKTCTRCPYFGRGCTGDPIAEGHQDFVEHDENGDPRCVVARGLIAHLEQRLWPMRKFREL